MEPFKQYIGMDPLCQSVYDKYEEEAFNKDVEVKDETKKHGQHCNENYLKFKFFIIYIVFWILMLMILSLSFVAVNGMYVDKNWQKLSMELSKE
ncbi:putative single-stranded DNA-binding protein (plasmid) [Mycoplasmopsis fermentans]|nr:putative single-stranded DNA-binding protein [Mycoplasmopsis fermentans]